MTSILAKFETALVLFLTSDLILSILAKFETALVLFLTSDLILANALP